MRFEVKGTDLHDVTLKEVLRWAYEQFVVRPREGERLNMHFRQPNPKLPSVRSARMDNSLFAHIFNGFFNDRILEEARDTLAAMGHHVEWDNELVVDIPPDVPLLVVRRSLCQDQDTHLGGYFTFDVAVGPNYTNEGVYSGVNDYGLLRLQFGLDGSYQDDYFYPSPLQWVDKARQYKPVVRVVADKREGYRGDS